jgi:transportin-3
MCVSALAVQMGWTSIVTDLLGALVNANNNTYNNTNGNNNSNKGVVLLLLRALPEECASDRLLLEDENIRYQMRDHFISNSALVFQFFQSALMDHNQPSRVYEAFHNWIRYVPVLASVVAETPLLDNVVQSMVSQEDLLEIGADILVEIFRMYPSHHEANEVLVHRMVPLVFSRLPLDQALSSPHADEDVQRVYCRIVTEIGESYMSLIVSPRYDAASQFVEWVLRCSNIAETDIASITLHFWYRLVVDLEQSEPFEFRQDLVDNYAPYLLRLIDACCNNLLRYPSNLEDLSDDRVDDIHRDRFYVAETIEDCCRLLGGHVVLERLGTKMREECQRIAEQQQRQPQKVEAEWQGIEACLFGIQCIHRFAARDEAVFLPACFALIPQLPPNVLPLRITANMLIGKYAAWLAFHQDILRGIWPYLVQGMSIRQCATTAAIAIKELCEFANQPMSLGEPVAQLYQEIVTNPGRVELRDELEILEGLCTTLSRQILQHAPESGHTQLVQLVQPIGDRFAMLVADPNANARSMIAEIERLIVVVRFLVVAAPSDGSSHPKVSLMSSVWPLLEGASQRYPHDVHLAEKICRLHKHSLRAIGTVHYAPLLDSLVEQLVRSFDRSQLSPYLYAGSICISEYGRDPIHSKRLCEMIQAYSVTAFSFLRSLEDLIQHPDVVEELFYLMGRVVINCPGSLVAIPQLLTSLLQCATVGLQLDHRDANRGTLNFLENAISYGLALRTQNQPEAKAALEHAFQSEGQGLVRNLARALVGELPTYSIDEGQGSIAGILWKLNAWSPSWLASWMATALNENADAAPERARLEFLAALDSSLAQSDFNLTIRAFMSACERHRRYRRGNRQS